MKSTTRTAGIGAAVVATGCLGLSSADAVRDLRAPAAAAAVTCTRTVVAAGDMNSLPVAVATGALAQALRPNLVTVLGDQQYPSGSFADYRSTYDKTGWGALKSITRPVPGNHEYKESGAAGYFAYFGTPPAYYAYDAGCGWRGYALNSEIDIATQARWLKSELAAHPSAKVLAYWHKPRYSSGTHHGSTLKMQPLVDALAGRSGVVLSGHEHHYERFAPIGGIRSFVVGTGGSSNYPFASKPVAGSAKRITGTPGVLLLQLRTGAYTWSFRNVANTALDSGSG